MWLGTFLVLRPLVVVADVVPLIGSLIGAGAGLVALAFTMVVAGLVIALAWFWYRPLVGLAGTGRRPDRRLLPSPAGRAPKRRTTRAPPRLARRSRGSEPWIGRICHPIALEKADMPGPKMLKLLRGGSMPRRSMSLFAATLLAFAAISNAASAQERRAPASLGQLQMSFAPIVQRVAPAVVNVYATHVVENQNPFMADPFFRQFFGGVPRRQVSVRSAPASSSIRRA